jgi:carboxypeptidase Taq
MMEEKIAKFRELIGLVADLQYASAVLGWDQETYMPSGGAQDRAMQLSTLNGLAHEKFVSDEVGSLLEELKSGLDEMDPNSDDSRLIIQIGKEFDKQRKIPNQWVGEFSKTTSLAQQNWKAARMESDFQKFQPDLERVIEMRKEYTEFFKPYDHIYDPLLDDFESGMKTAEVKAVFDDLRPQQVELIQAISDSKHPVNDAILHQEFDERKQWDFGIEVIKAFGYDLERGRQDRSTHPFTTSFGTGDVRITTRIYPDYLSSGLFSTLHEAGHGMYGQGIDPKLSRSLIADGASLGMHESQSRMWENLVGRSRHFWVAFFPRLKEFFPSQLGNVELDEFYRAINKVERSLIRVEADEATYNLHIMLRFEIELGLIEGKLAPKDLPEIWNTKMDEYLGITPTDDAKGVLQDIHWSFGILGYFPTYSLGNLIASMLWEQIHEDIPELESQIAMAEFDSLFTWLRENIHVHGAKFEPLDLVRKITGSGLTAEPYINYLNSKFREIYRL